MARSGTPVRGNSTSIAVEPARVSVRATEIRPRHVEHDLPPPLEYGTWRGGRDQRVEHTGICRVRDLHGLGRAQVGRAHDHVDPIRREPLQHPQRNLDRRRAVVDARQEVRVEVDQADE